MRKMKLNSVQCVLLLSIFVLGSIMQSEQAPVQRKLTTMQKSKLKKELAGMAAGKTKMRIVCPVSDENDDSCSYALDFAEVFSEAGWNIEGWTASKRVTQVRFLGHLQPGTFFMVSADDVAKKTVPADALRVLALLQANRIPVTYQSSDDVARGMFELRVLFSPDYTPPMQYYPQR